MTPNAAGFNPPPRSAWCACDSPPRSDRTSDIGLTPPGHALRANLVSFQAHAAANELTRWWLFPSLSE